MTTIWNLTCTWSDTVRPWQNIDRNAPGVKSYISRIPLIGLVTRNKMKGSSWVKLKSSLRKFDGRYHEWWLGWPLWNICVTNDHRYMYVLLVVNTSRSFPRSWLITGFATRLTRRVSLVEQELLTLPQVLERLSSPPLFVCFSFSFGYCVVCSSSIYDHEDICSKLALLTSLLKGC